MRARLEEFALTPRSASRIEPEKTRLIEFGRRAAVGRGSAGWASRNLQLPGLYDDLRQVAARQVSAVAAIPARSAAGEAFGGEGGTAAADASADSPARGVAAGGGQRMVQPSRGADQHPLSSDLPWLRGPALAALAAATWPARQDHLGTDEAAGRRLPAEAAHLHPWPEQRFAVKHPRWEPYAGKPLVRFRAGGAR
jgi:hypothetical protein